MVQRVENSLIANISYTDVSSHRLYNFTPDRDKREWSAVNMLLTQTQMDQILLLGEGNPGALRVLGTIACESENRPQPPEYYFDILTRAGVKGSQVWMLYKDECNQDMDRLRERIEKL